MSDLDFEWDTPKALANLAKHGVAFEQAATVFLDPLALTVYDRAHSDEKERWFTLGHTPDGALLAIAHTYQPTAPTRVRVRLISVRPATRGERHTYENEPR